MPQMDLPKSSSPARLVRPKSSKSRHVPSSSTSFAHLDSDFPQQSTPPPPPPPLLRHYKSSSTLKRPVGANISQPSLVQPSPSPMLPFEAPRPAPPLPKPKPRPEPVPMPMPVSPPANSSQRSLRSRTASAGHLRNRSIGTDSRDASHDSDESSIVCSMAAEFDEVLARHDRVLAAEKRRKGLDDTASPTPEEVKHRQAWAVNAFERMTRRVAGSRFIREVYRKREKSSSLGRSQDFDMKAKAERGQDGYRSSAASSAGKTSSEARVRSQDSAPSSQGGEVRVPSMDSSSNHGERARASTPHGQRDEYTQHGSVAFQHDTYGHEHGSQFSNLYKNANEPPTERCTSVTPKRPMNPPDLKRSNRSFPRHVRTRSTPRQSPFPPPKSPPPTVPIPPVPATPTQQQQIATPRRCPSKDDQPEGPSKTAMPRIAYNTDGSDLPARSSGGPDDYVQFPTKTQQPDCAFSPALVDPFLFKRYEGDKGSVFSSPTMPPRQSSVQSQLSALALPPQSVSNGVRDTFGGMPHEDSEFLEDLIAQAENDLTILPRRMLQDEDHMQTEPTPVVPLAISRHGSGAPTTSPEKRTSTSPGKRVAKEYVDEDVFTSAPRATPANIATRLASRLRTMSSASSSHDRPLLGKKRSAKSMAKRFQRRGVPTEEELFNEPIEPFTLGLTGMPLSPPESSHSIAVPRACSNGSIMSVGGASQSAESTVSSIFDDHHKYNDSDMPDTPNTSISDSEHGR